MVLNMYLQIIVLLKCENIKMLSRYGIEMKNAFKIINKMWGNYATTT